MSVENGCSSDRLYESERLLCSKTPFLSAQSPSVPLTCPAHQRKIPSTGRLHDGRKEKRNRRTFLATLSSTRQPLAMALASAENVSSCGMRVQTDRPWKLETRLVVETSRGERSATARVVYCQSLSRKEFAVGLEFLARTGELVTRD